jgi:tetratricopeptide (TPR) repeat protein
MARSLQLSLFLLLILCLCMPAVIAATDAGLITAAGDTQGPPPRDAEGFAADAKAAMEIRDWPGMLTATTRGLAWYPDDTALLCQHGYALRKLGQYERSVEAVSKAILIDPQAVRYSNRGYGYLALENYSAALADADTGIALDAGYTTNYGVKALALLGMGRTAEARDTIDAALTLSPDSAQYRHIRGLVLAGSGDCAGARADLERSLELDKGYSLPWPGFAGAQEILDSLDSTCRPATLPSTPTPQAATGGVAVLAATGVAIIVTMRR